MNSSRVCHEIPGCPNCYVDAFRGVFLKKTANENQTIFILTHYHGDHYGNLPRDNKYQGPATIHCTPITAALLIRVHGVSQSLVVAHEYGETWRFDTTKITFYDANHCPGAAIVVFELDDGTVHLHTGDMRYCPMMQTYDILQRAALERKIDTVLLDTTYGNPKHDFMPQEQAVELIASQAQQLLGSDPNINGTTLVLLSCYSIGKERVLWDVSQRTNQLIYVSERKRRMLECIKTTTDKHHCSNQIIDRCTDDANASNVHVIPMGLAGELWPYFVAKPWAVAEYAEKLTKNYSKVVAFLPTGWAEATNWNKKNATTTKKCRGVDVEIRLISYSEHSAFTELQEFCRFLKARKIVPTVFKDSNDARKIAARFSIDSTRAKAFFLKSLGGACPPKKHATKKESSSDDDVKFIKESKNSPPNSCVLELVSMGFTRHDAELACDSTDGNLQAALDSLLIEKGGTKTISPSPTKKPTTPHSRSAPMVRSKPKSPPKRSMLDFFPVAKKKR